MDAPRPRLNSPPRDVDRKYSAACCASERPADRGRPVFAGCTAACAAGSGGEELAAGAPMPQNACGGRARAAAARNCNGRAVLAIACRLPDGGRRLGTEATGSLLRQPSAVTRARSAATSHRRQHGPSATRSKASWTCAPRPAATSARDGKTRAVWKIEAATSADQAAALPCASCSARGARAADGGPPSTAIPTGHRWAVGWVTCIDKYLDGATAAAYRRWRRARSCVLPAPSPRYASLVNRCSRLREALICAAARAQRWRKRPSLQVFVEQQRHILMQRPLISFQAKYIVRFLVDDLRRDGTLAAHRVDGHHRCRATPATATTPGAP